jgi:hypothetical protein
MACGEHFGRSLGLLLEPLGWHVVDRGACIPWDVALQGARSAGRVVSTALVAHHSGLSDHPLHRLPFSPKQTF